MFYGIIQAWTRNFEGIKEKEGIFMNKRLRRDDSKAIYVDTDGLASALSVGRASAVRVGKEAGAFVKIGGSTRFNLNKVLDFIAQNEEGGKA